MSKRPCANSTLPPRGPTRDECPSCWWDRTLRPCLSLCSRTGVKLCRSWLSLNTERVVGTLHSSQEYRGRALGRPRSIRILLPRGAHRLGWLRAPLVGPRCCSSLRPLVSAHAPSCPIYVPVTQNILIPLHGRSIPPPIFFSDFVILASPASPAPQPWRDVACILPLVSIHPLFEPF